MPDPMNFSALMAEVGKFQAGLSKVRAELTNPAQREILGKILSRLQTAKAEAQVTVPAALTTIKESIANTRKGIAAEQAKIPAKKAEVAELKAKLKKPKAPAAVPPKPEVKVDPALGGKLREELLGRYGKSLGLDDEALPERIKEAWQDWG